MTKLHLQAIGNGAVKLQAASSTAAASYSLETTAGVVTVDLTSPGQPPCCVFSDLVSDAEALTELYGPLAAQQTLLAAETDTAQAEAPFEPEDPELAQQLSQLGVLRWLQEYSPLPLDRWLLALEERVLSSQLAGILDDQDEPLEELAELSQQIFDLAKSTQHRYRPVTQLLAQALIEVSECAPAGSGWGKWARKQLPTLPHPSETEEPLPAPADLPYLRPAMALAAGEELFAGSDTVDWDAVPRGWISYEEHNALWKLELGPEQARFEVSVPGPSPITWFGGLPGDGPEPDDSCGFQVFAGEIEEPLLLGSMHFNAARNLWSGQADATGGAADQLAEHIYDGKLLVLQFDDAPRRSQIYLQLSAAIRWASRAVSALRLSQGNQTELIQGAAQAATTAAGEWEAAGCSEEAEACRRLATPNLGDWGSNTRLSVAEQWFLASTQQQPTR